MMENFEYPVNETLSRQEVVLGGVGFRAGTDADDRRSTDLAAVYRWNARGGIFGGISVSLRQVA